MINDREEVVRRWVLYERLSGRLVGQRDEPRPFVTVPLDGAVLVPLTTAPRIEGGVRRIVKKHRDAKSDAAQKTRRSEFNAVGLPASTREFVVEGEPIEVFIPFYVGLLERKGRMRAIAIHAGNGARVESVEKALHEKIDIVRRALDEAHAPVGIRVADDDGADVAPPCTCGAEMVLRHRRSDGEAFWGCSTYPRCRHTRPTA